MRKTQFDIRLLALGLILVTGCDPESSSDVSERSCQGAQCGFIGNGDGNGLGNVVVEDDLDIESGGTCGSPETALIAGQHTNTGSIQVTNDNGSISIAVLPTAPYELAEVHIYVGTGPVPTKRNGAVAPGQFPYAETFAQSVGDYQLEVPLAELAAACGDDLNIAVHAVIVSADNQGDLQFQETAWGFGPNEFENGWGWHFTHELCCDDAPDEPTDDDDDGVGSENDCDDNDPRIGALLYENHFDNDDGYLGLGPQLLDPWVLWGSEIHTTDGGQQALLGQAENWGDTVTFGTLRVSAIETECGNNCVEDNTRFRAGFLARTTVDEDQDEGYHGYRCAVAQNSGADCYDPGPFVQLSAFLDVEEDDVNSECVNGCVPNPSFDQLDREERSEGTNFGEGDSGSLVFWAVGQELVCEFYGNDDEHVVAHAIDDRFDTGTTGLSTLNALADFDHVKVCQAFEAP
jgi:hypothetical protein